MIEFREFINKRSFNLLETNSDFFFFDTYVIVYIKMIYEKYETQLYYL